MLFLSLFKFLKLIEITNKWPEDKLSKLVKGIVTYFSNLDKNDR